MTGIVVASNVSVSTTTIQSVTLRTCQYKSLD